MRGIIVATRRLPQSRLDGRTTVENPSTETTESTPAPSDGTRNGADSGTATGVAETEAPSTATDTKGAATSETPGGVDRAQKSSGDTPRSGATERASDEDDDGPTTDAEETGAPSGSATADTGSEDTTPEQAGTGREAGSVKEETNAEPDTEDPDSSAVGQVLAELDDRARDGRIAAAERLLAIAENDPEIIERHLDRLRNAYGDEPEPAVRERLIEVFG